MNIVILGWIYFKILGQCDPERQKKGNAVGIYNKKRENIILAITSL